MTFPYQIVKGIGEDYKIYQRTLPWIPVTIFNPAKPNKSITVLCLADTGSDQTFFTTEIGIYLGFDIAKGIVSKLYGIGGGQQTVYYFKEVGIKISDPTNKELPIEFVDSMGFTSESFPLQSPQQTGILGTVGFFRNVNMLFNYPKEMRLTINKNLN